MESQGNFHKNTEEIKRIDIFCDKNMVAQVSWQFQFPHGNFNFLTAISICSRQFQFAHGSFNFAHGSLSEIETAVSEIETAVSKLKLPSHTHKKALYKQRFVSIDEIALATIFHIRTAPLKFSSGRHSVTNAVICIPNKGISCIPNKGISGIPNKEVSCIPNKELPTK